MDQRLVSVNHVVYEGEDVVVFTAEIASGTMALKVPNPVDVGTLSLGINDCVVAHCDRDRISAVTLRVNLPTGYTNTVRTGGTSVNWTIVGTIAELSVPVPVDEGDAVALAFRISSTSGATATARKHAGPTNNAARTTIDDMEGGGTVLASSRRIAPPPRIEPA